MRKKRVFPAHSRISWEVLPEAGMRGWRRSAVRTGLWAKSLQTGDFAGKTAVLVARRQAYLERTLRFRAFWGNSLLYLTGK